MHDSTSKPKWRGLQPAGFDFALSEYPQSKKSKVAPGFRAGQRLKPHRFLILNGTAEAVPYKDL